MKCWQVVKVAIQRMRPSRSKPALEAEARSSSREPPAPEEWPPPTPAAVLIIAPVALETQATAEGKTPPGSPEAAT
jgi:hypothetical protein